MRLWDEAWRGPYALLPLLTRAAPVVVAGVRLSANDWIDPDVLLQEHGTPRAFVSLRDGSMPGVAGIGAVAVARRREAMRVRDLLARDAGGERIYYLPQVAPVVRRADGTLLATAVGREGYEPWRVGPQFVARPQYETLVETVPSNAGDALQAWNVLRYSGPPVDDGVACGSRAPPFAERG